MVVETDFNKILAIIVCERFESTSKMKFNGWAETMEIQKGLICGYWLD